MSRYRTLFSWSRITSKIKELIVTPLQEGCRGEKEGGGDHVRQVLRLRVARPNNITRDK